MVLQRNSIRFKEEAVSLNWLVVLTTSLFAVLCLKFRYFQLFNSVSNYVKFLSPLHYESDKAERHAQRVIGS